ncbi:MAG: DUF503 domain-containing protein [Aquificaceae bacterium]|nr:DUF503 domain-containing protein [Aquificaceae bacterium]MCX8060405.1 DUF503 domain-containing protein [Aquificaceae bacterium]MDW8097646.1 DUF503 domain-containing protein [Aquificaceae bacterium]
MVLGVLRAELFFHESSSLKEKRQYLRSIKDKVRSSLNVSVAEVDHQDLWQRSSLAFVCVAGDRPIAENTLDRVKKLLERHYPELLLEVKTEFIKL